MGSTLFHARGREKLYLTILLSMKTVNSHHDVLICKANKALCNDASAAYHFSSSFGEKTYITNINVPTFKREEGATCIIDIVSKSRRMTIFIISLYCCGFVFDGDPFLT